MPDDEYPIMTDALMKALVADKAGFTYLTRTLEVLLQTLLQDGIAEVNVLLCVRYFYPFSASLCVIQRFTLKVDTLSYHCLTDFREYSFSVRNR